MYVISINVNSVLARKLETVCVIKRYLPKELVPHEPHSVSSHNQEFYA